MTKRGLFYFWRKSSIQIRIENILLSANLKGITRGKYSPIDIAALAIWAFSDYTMQEHSISSYPGLTYFQSMAVIGTFNIAHLDSPIVLYFLL